MSQLFLISVVAFSILLLLFLVLYFKIHAFIALLIVSVVVGAASGMSLQEVIESIESGMGGTLGFVATVVGLGAIFGQILEASGGAQSIAVTLIRRFGRENASWALVLAGFIIAIPVFLDVGFIILVPIVYALSKDTKKSILFYGIPLCAGLAVTHAFIPPTPGPVAVADILEADLGWVILLGFIVGLPTAVVAGPVFGKYIAGKINVAPPDYLDTGEKSFDEAKLPSFALINLLIGIPLFLILLSTVSDVLVDSGVFEEKMWVSILRFIGHPFIALIIATLLSLYFLGIKRGFNRKQLLDLSGKALGPAGLIILVTGAGGVFKQILIDSGVGTMLATEISNSNLPPLLLAYLLAVIVRVTQGSATVAMITAAGIIQPILGVFDLSPAGVALVVLVIAAGATTASHVNDSGFWLVGKYLGLTEKQTLQSWTVMETIISVVGFILAFLISFWV